ncbi:MAG: thioesterase family protein [Alkalispirochaeta sp.]
MNFPGIKTGMTLTRRHTITEEDTYGNHLPDDIEKLLSTGATVSLITEASVRLIDSHLPQGFISVGKSSEVVHEHPTVIGDTLSITVTLVAFDGYHLTIAAELSDESGVCGRGTHVRSIVNKRWLQLKVARRVAER